MLTESETAETQNEKKMQDLYNLGPKHYDEKKVVELMSRTYYSQRVSINQKKYMNDIIEEWPFLFQKHGLLNHFNELVGLNINKKLSQVKSEK